ncbi:hypothetical protein MTsPCn3_07230 [Erythrobacter sp. MTPC3]
MDRPRKAPETNPANAFHERPFGVIRTAFVVKLQRPADSRRPSERAEQQERLEEEPEHHDDERKHREKSPDRR